MCLCVEDVFSIDEPPPSFGAGMTSVAAFSFHEPTDLKWDPLTVITNFSANICTRFGSPVSHLSIIIISLLFFIWKKNKEISACRRVAGLKNATHRPLGKGFNKGGIQFFGRK